MQRDIISRSVKFFLWNTTRSLLRCTAKMISATVLLTISCLHMALGMSSFPLIIENLSFREMAHVEGLRDIVKNDLPNDYMSSDAFLARWLKEKDFDLESAEELLREVKTNMTWINGIVANILTMICLAEFKMATTGTDWLYPPWRVGRHEYQIPVQPYFWR